jgi:hypothetical protein
LQDIDELSLYHVRAVWFVGIDSIEMAPSVKIADFIDCARIPPAGNLSEIDVL